MKFLGYEIMKSSDFQGFQSTMSNINKRLKEFEKARPTTEEGMNASVSDDGVKLPQFPIDEKMIYSLSLDSDILRTAIRTVRQGIFRRGFNIRTINDDSDELAFLQAVLKKINTNGQSAKRVLGKFEDDLNSMDDAYLISIKKYYFSPNGEILFSEPKEIIRGSPLKMRIVADKQGRLGYTDEGKRVYFSLNDRSRSVKEEEAEKTNFKDNKGHKLQIACYRGEVGNGKYIYYSAEEICHKSKFNPSLTYGYSPILAIWRKAYTLIEQDRYLMIAYQKHRSPRAMLTIATSNFDSLQKAWEQLKREAADDPHSINPLIYETEKGRSGVDYVDLMRPLTEMQYIEGRNEMRRSIGAIYGVMPLFGGDIQTSGGLNNEGNQFAVTNKAVEEGQEIYNEEVLPWILDQFGIQNYELKLEEPEERDETEDTRRLGIKMDNAVKMSSMGFDITWNEDSKDFTYSEKPVRNPSGEESGETEMGGQQSFAGMPFKSSKYDEGSELDFGSTEIHKDNKKELLEIIKEALFNKKFKGITKAVSDKIKKTILESITFDWTVDKTIEEVKKAGLELSQAEAIVRTEQQAVQTKIREFNFKNMPESENFKYKWIGPADHRTTKICKEISEATKKGVSLDKLKDTIQKVGKKHKSDPREFTPHPQCRHTFVRMV